MKQWSKQKTKWALLSLIPVIAVPSITVAAIYGVRQSRDNTSSVSRSLSDIELKETLAKELNEIYQENPELKENQSFSFDDFILEDVKIKVREAESKVSRYQLKKMLRRVLEDYLTRFQTNIENYIDSKEAKAVDELYTQFSKKLIEVQDLARDAYLPEDLLAEDMWLYGAIRKLSKYETIKDEIKHKEQLVLLINEINDQIEHYKELKDAIIRADYIHNLEMIGNKRLPVDKKAYGFPRAFTRVRDNTFANIKFDRKLVIPEWVTSIGKKAFYQADLSNGITFLGRIKEIDDQAFMGAKLPDDFRLPSSVTKMGDEVFKDTMLPMGFEAESFLIDQGKFIGSVPDYTTWWDASLTNEQIEKMLEDDDAFMAHNDAFAPRKKIYKWRYWAIKEFDKDKKWARK